MEAGRIVVQGDPGMIGGINFWRRAVQWASFIVLVYAAFLFPHPLETGFLPETKAPPGLPSTARFDRTKILWASDDPPRIDAYPPSAMCRFMPRGGMFKACVLHFISENLTWGTELKYLLPHIFVFSVLAFLFARLCCGWVCPLGSIGDVMCWIRKKLGYDHLKFSRRTQRVLKYSNYAILALALGLSALIFLPALGFCRDELFLPYCQICPGKLVFPLFGGRVPAWHDFSTRIYGVFTVLGWLFAVLFVLAFFTGKNVWCRLCPIGTFTSFFNRGGAAALRKDQGRCSNCGICADACPVASTHVYDQRRTGDASHADCILCLRCVELCPKNGCLSFALFGAKLAESSFKPANK
jgi:polyferredoxin